MRQPVEIRLPAAIRVYAVCFGLLWVGGLVAATITLPLSEAPFAILMMAFGGALILRMESLKFAADESGVLVRNFYRTWRFRWDEVEDFRLGRPMMAMPFGQVIHMLLRNGEVITIDVTAAHWAFLFGGKVKREQTLQRLRLWLPPRD
jgi:hypothetical protein